MSILLSPELASDPLITKAAKTRAEYYLRYIEGGLGSYPPNLGFDFAIEGVARYITNRDGIACGTSNIATTTNDNALQFIIQAVFQNIFSTSVDQKECMMVPRPLASFYSTLDPCYRLNKIGYNLSTNSRNWTVSTDALQLAYDLARREGRVVKAILVINPGESTGCVYSEKELQTIVEFALHNKLVIIADETYQRNIYNPATPFVSLRKTLLSMPSPYNAQPLFVVDSMGDLMLGKPGLKMGYYQAVNIDEDIWDNATKQHSYKYSMNSLGNVYLDLAINPPQDANEGEALEVERYKNEIETRKNILRKKANIIENGLISSSGINCAKFDAGFSVSPTIEVPHAMSKSASKMGISEELLFCLELYKATGVTVGCDEGNASEAGFLRVGAMHLDEDTIKTTMNKIKGFCQDIQ